MRIIEAHEPIPQEALPISVPVEVKSVPRGIDLLLRAMIDRGASDLHLAAGSPAMFRVDGKLEPYDMNVLNNDVVQEMAYSILDPMQQQRLEEDRELDFSYGVR